MKKLTLLRYHQDDEVTFGLLYIDGLNKPIYTLENPWIGNKRNVSCIPEGIYEGGQFNGYKYKNVYEIREVENRSDILIHIGNYPNNTLGCILPGLGVENTNRKMVIHSSLAMNKIRTVLGKRDFQIEIECLDGCLRQNPYYN